jgi:FtsP/CotA-like multicopper oxidase with cupredoxin domain
VESSAEQKRIDAFMADIKAVCEKHGLRFSNVYDERIDIVDTDGQTVADYVNVDDLRATPYEPYEPGVSGGEAVTLSEGEILLKEYYAAHMVKAINEPSPLLKRLLNKYSMGD